MSSLVAEFRWIWDRCRRRLGDLIAFALAFKALNVILLAPLAAGILRLCLLWWGRAAVGNFELAAFFLSPPGWAALLLVGGVLVASLYLELAGLLCLLTDNRPWWDAFHSSTQLFPRLVRLGLRQLTMYVLLAAPFLVVVGLAYGWFWSGRDINGLIILRPPEFWRGASVAAIAVLGFAWFAGRMFLRQLFAVPVLILEPGTDVVSALAVSEQRTRGDLLRSAGALAVWFVGQSCVAAVTLGAVHLALGWILEESAASLTQAVLATGFVLVAHFVTGMLLSLVADISLAGVVLALYRKTAPDLVETPREGVSAPQKGAADSTRRNFSRAAMSAGGLSIGLVAAAITAFVVARGLKLPDNLEITAHRAGATSAPENTVAALKRAIADGADWAEIDVQLTADQALVVMHDTDLARVGGGKRGVGQSTLAEIQALDVGTPFGPAFAGERVPEFKDILATAGDGIRLNVELKPHGRADGDELARRVVEEIRGAGMTARCRICSQSYESLQTAKVLEPAIEIGYISAVSVGDSTKLNVQFLMVKHSLATREFIVRAGSRGIAVHAWTVNDPALVAPLLDAGVANLITDDPKRMRTRLEELRALSAPERLLLQTARVLGR